MLIWSDLILAELIYKEKEKLRQRKKVYRGDIWEILKYQIKEIKIEITTNGIGKKTRIALVRRVWNNW